MSTKRRVKGGWGSDPFNLWPPSAPLTTPRLHHILMVTPPQGGWVEGKQPMTEKTKSDILRRLKSIEGHVRGIARMVENGDYCIDILNQTLAVERALHKVNTLVLDRHLHTCVTTAIRGNNPDERERVIEEIMDVFNAAGKR